jgi:hypothetical protein
MTSLRDRIKVALEKGRRNAEQFLKANRPGQGVGSRRY